MQTLKDIRLVSQGPFALFSNFILTRSSGKHVEDLGRTHIVSLRYRIITCAEDFDDLVFGFDQDRNRRRDELVRNKNTKSKYYLKFTLKDVFGFAQCQEKVNFGLGYKLTLVRNKDDAVLDNAADIADARIDIDHFHWYGPHYTPSFQQQGILSKQISSKTPTKFRYIERSVFMEEVNNQFLWKFEICGEESTNVSVWIIIGFQQKNRQDSQNLNNDTFCRIPVTSCQCITGTEGYPDSGMLLNYDDDDYSQGYGQTTEAFRALTKDDILQPCKSDHGFRSSNVRADDNGYNFYVFDI